MWRSITLAVFSYYTATVLCQFYECHDDTSITPPEGTLGERQFTWLGVLQYIHISVRFSLRHLAHYCGPDHDQWSERPDLLWRLYRDRALGHNDQLAAYIINSIVQHGRPHYFRLPRVILISRQFVLSTAADAAHVPKNYALGNVAFANYERDEDECKITIHDLEEGVECEPAALLMPIADVLLHPEFKHFGVRDSIAILKLVTMVRSVYMLPVCLPFKNFLIDKFGRLTRERIMHIDFLADVPREFGEEEKEVTRISLLPKELCHVFAGPRGENLTVSARLICTTGCGFHSGAPAIVHEHTGHWSLVAIAAGGPSCPDPLRGRRPAPPARHIAIHPYVPWITAAITGKAIGAFAKDDPFGFIMPRAKSAYDFLSHQWLGHWWMGGLRCFDRGEAADDMFKFYHEVFSMKPTTTAFVNYYLELSAPPSVKIICVKVGMPYRYGRPRVWDLDGPQCKVLIPMVQFRFQYMFQIEAWGYNCTMETVSSSQDYDADEGEPGPGGSRPAKITEREPKEPAAYTDSPM